MEWRHSSAGGGVAEMVDAAALDDARSKSNVSSRNANEIPADANGHRNESRGDETSQLSQISDHDR